MSSRYYATNCTCFDCSFRRHESDERWKRVEAVWEERRRHASAARPIEAARQRDAALAEIERLKAEIAAGSILSPRERLAQADEIKRLRAEVAAMRPVVEAARAMLPDWDDQSGSFSRVDAMNEHCETIAAAVDVLDTGATKRRPEFRRGG